MENTVNQLGYLIFNIQNDHLSELQIILENLFGAEWLVREDGHINVKLDGRDFRILLRTSGKSQLYATGWQVSTMESLNTIRTKVESTGLSPIDLNRQEIHERKIKAGFRFLDQNQSPIEIFIEDDFSESEKINQKFLTSKDFGFGHIVHITKDLSASKNFYRDILGFKLSDRITWDAADLFFLHCNKRHHSVALAGEVFGLKAGMIDHFMIEAQTLEQVKNAWERIPELGLKVSMTLGQHSNDDVISFYLMTRAGFRIEFGYGGKPSIENGEEDIKTYASPSVWGHDLVMG